MDLLIKYIEPYLERYNKTISSGFKVSRRGFCGVINFNNILPSLIRDLSLEAKNVESRYRSGQLYDIYYSPSKNFYLKRMCVCSDGCSSKCGKNKNKLNCDGHHAIIVSLNDSLDIDIDSDYVIDFTYKQMIYSAAEEDANMETMIKLPDYLFIPYSEYVSYSNTERWKRNIFEPCKIIVNNSNLVTSEYKNKYLKYKNKYLALKKSIKL